MHISVKSETDKKNNQVFLIPVSENLVPEWFTPDETLYIKKHTQNKSDVIVINRITQLIVLITVDLANDENTSSEILRRKGNQLLTILGKEEITAFDLVTTLENRELILAFLEGVLLGNYQFLKYFTNTKDKKQSKLNDINIVSEIIKPKHIKRLKNITDAVYFTRNLVNEPFSYLTINQFVSELKQMAKQSKINIEVLTKKQIESLKMGGLLAVNQGSKENPAFVILEWKPEKPINKAPVVLVGKGIVYDTGGYSLKPTAQSMDYMKCDMAGAATVAGIIKAIADNEEKLHLIALIPITDNALSEKSYVPGDVIKMHNKLTVEVLNTDAEGRLILADALSYAANLNPDLVIDMATLTGAAAVAIGIHGMVVMGTAPEADFSLLQKTGNRTYERIVQFPLWEEYKKDIESGIADIKNIGGREGGAITAGKFLECFVSYPWIHFDIATNAYIHKSHEYWPAGATGVGIRLIYNFLLNKYN